MFHIGLVEQGALPFALIGVDRRYFAVDTATREEKGTDT
jgi:hypothetical protein